jgi:hypothetical protein
MTAEAWIAIATAGAALATLITIFVLLKGVRDQLWMIGFIVYTDRYAKVMRALPFEARQPGSDYTLDRISEEERASLLSVMREYFNLCSEEFWLMRNKRIDRRTWDVWVQGMREVARFPSFNGAWAQLRREYRFFRDFGEFMDDLARTAAKETSPPDGAAGPSDSVIGRGTPGRSHLKQPQPPDTATPSES